MAIPHVINHKYIGAKWSVVCTNVLVHYLKGSFMFLSHCLFVRTLPINLAGESGKGNIFTNLAAN
jgi:hypothetical protein